MNNEFCANCTYIKNDGINPPLAACPSCGCNKWNDRPPDGYPGARKLPGDNGWTIDVNEETIREMHARGML